MNMVRNVYKIVILVCLFILYSLNIVAQEYVEDCEGHKYPVAYIGSQRWMGENLRCSTYDTKSERAGTKLIKWESSDSATAAPHYYDERFGLVSAQNITFDVQYKFGYHYTWAAAMGYSEQEAMSKENGFSESRQGICPNGWHIPSFEEIEEMLGFVSDNSKKPNFNALKSEIGWNTGGSDNYKFSLLPSGMFFSDTHIKNVNSYFWYNKRNIDEEASVFGYETSRDSLWSYRTKMSDGSSVRCIKNTEYVTDCQGHKYPTVSIGNQVWMAENLQCTKYDTKSEKAGKVLATSDSATYAPYYADGRYVTTEYSEKLTNEQRQHLGLLYNWAAAMGYTESQARSQTDNYSGRRQGICPNGWHLPNRADWNTLAESIGGESKVFSCGYIEPNLETQLKSNGVPGVVSYGYVAYSNIGAKLKSKRGWYEDGNGTDDSGFSSLPAGNATGNNVNYVGKWTYYWSSDARSRDTSYESCLHSKDSHLDNEYDNFKTFAQSVRCLKD